MFCNQCGAEIVSEAYYCTKCGASVTKVAECNFFTTSTLKFILMSICTFGIYELYWFYKNWCLIKARTGENIMPFWRAFFAPIWAYDCFKRMKQAAEENNLKNDLQPGVLALIFFVVQALWRLPDPYGMLSIFSFLPILPANMLASNLNKQLNPDFRNNDNFTGWNWVALILGGLFVALTVFAAFVPIEDSAV